MPKNDHGEKVSARELLDAPDRWTGQRVTTGGTVAAMADGVIEVAPLAGGGVLRCRVRPNALLELNAREMRVGAVGAVNGRALADGLDDCRFRGGR